MGGICSRRRVPCGALCTTSCNEKRPHLHTAHTNPGKTTKYMRRYDTHKSLLKKCGWNTLLSGIESNRIKWFRGAAFIHGMRVAVPQHWVLAPHDRVVALHQHVAAPRLGVIIPWRGVVPLYRRAITP